MKIIFLWFLAFFSPFWAQDFLFNQGADRGEWTLNQLGDTIFFNQNAGCSCLPTAACNTLSFYQKKDSLWFGNVGDNGLVQYLSKGKNKFVLRAGVEKSDVYSFVYQPKLQQLQSLDHGGIYLNKSLEHYFYEKMAGVYLNGTDTLTFYSDGHAQGFYLDKNYYTLLQGDNFGLSTDMIRFYPDAKCLDINRDCNVYCNATGFSLVYTKKELLLYNLIETICSDCKPEYSQGQLLYTLKRLK
jgi:hypothetical protein